MNARERFIETVHFGKPDRTFLMPHWFFKENFNRWMNEGMPRDVYPNTYFGFDRYEEEAPIKIGLIPEPETKVIEENKKTKTVVDEFGSKWRIWKDLEIGMPHWIEYGLKDRKSWLKYREHLDPKAPLRYPEYWDDLKRCWKERDYPLGIRAGSFYGWIRNWAGMENLALMYYDDPDLVHEITDYLVSFIIKVIERAVQEVDFDFALFWEDMAMKTGPLISPELFKEFILPCYKKVTSFLKDNGIDIMLVDSDGNNDLLIPLWLEGGVNGIYPLEVAAGSDAVALRKKYGKQLILIGNIDKRVLSKEKGEIEDEVLSKVPYLVSQGGYIPLVDHGVPPDVPFDNFCYYLELVKEIIGNSKMSR